MNNIQELYKIVYLSFPNEYEFGNSCINICRLYTLNMQRYSENRNGKMSIWYKWYHITYQISDAFHFSGELLQDFLSIYFLFYFFGLIFIFLKAQLNAKTYKKR